MLPYSCKYIKKIKFSPNIVLFGNSTFLNLELNVWHHCVALQSLSNMLIKYVCYKLKPQKPWSHAQKMGVDFIFYYCLSFPSYLLNPSFYYEKGLSVWYSWMCHQVPGHIWIQSEFTLLKPLMESTVKVADEEVLSLAPNACFPSSEQILSVKSYSAFLSPPLLTPLHLLLCSI